MLKAQSKMFIINYITKYDYDLLSDFMRPIIIAAVSLPPFGFDL